MPARRSRPSSSRCVRGGHERDGTDDSIRELRTTERRESRCRAGVRRERATGVEPTTSSLGSVENAFSEVRGNQATAPIKAGTADAGGVEQRAREGPKEYLVGGGLHS